MKSSQTLRKEHILKEIHQKYQNYAPMLGPLGMEGVRPGRIHLPC